MRTARSSFQRRTAAIFGLAFRRIRRLVRRLVRRSFSGGVSFSGGWLAEPQQREGWLHRRNRAGRVPFMGYGHFSDGAPLEGRRNSNRVFGAFVMSKSPCVMTSIPTSASHTFRFIPMALMRIT